MIRWRDDVCLKFVYLELSTGTGNGASDEYHALRTATYINNNVATGFKALQMEINRPFWSHCIELIFRNRSLPPHLRFVNNWAGPRFFPNSKSLVGPSVFLTAAAAAPPLQDKWWGTFLSLFWTLFVPLLITGFAPPSNDWTWQLFFLFEWSSERMCRFI